MESEDEEGMCKCLMANPFDTERLIAEATEDEDDLDFEPGEEEEEALSIAEFVKNKGMGRDFSANYLFASVKTSSEIPVRFWPFFL
jgi:hypothetical protein